MHAQDMAIVGLVAVLGSLLVLVVILKRIIYICPPNEVLIFSGGHRKLGENVEWPDGPSSCFPIPAS